MSNEPTTQPPASAAAGPESRTIRLGRIRHYNEDTAFLIADASDASSGAGFVVKGEILAPQRGESYEMIGSVKSDRYGEAFVFRMARLLLPDSTVGMERFLSKSLHGVGPAIAAQIVAAYGLQTLEILAADPERVAREIDGLSELRAAGISEWLRAHERETALRMALEQMLGGIPDLPHKTIDAAIEEWGDDAPGAIKANPYILTELPRIGFRRADEIAIARFGYDRAGLARRKAAVLFALAEEAATNGHTTLPDSDLIRTVNNLIGHEPGNDALRELAESGAIVAHVGEVQLGELADAERTIADRIRILNSTANPISESRRITVDPTRLEPDQLAAVAKINAARVTILTGAPGTGKTWTVARIVAAARAAGYTVRLAAPTGKAAKRLTESLAAVGGGSATTLHRLLGATIREKTGRWEFAVTRKNPFGGRTLFVVDEKSMVDTVMAARFFDAIHDDSRVLLVGDTNQLASIGAGAVLRDLITSETLPHAELTIIKRNAGDLVKAIHAIKAGTMPEFSARLDLPDHNIRMVEVGSDEIHAALLDIIGRIGKRGFDPIWDVQVMSPLNEKGSMSCDALNPLLSESLNPAAGAHKGLAFREGDKVVRTENGRVGGRYLDPADLADAIARQQELGFEYDGTIEVVNGDIGKVESIDEKLITVRHWNPDRVVNYNRKDHKLRLAYCLTVHKMQGSSAPVTILPMHDSFVGPIWTREWIYTAISRAEKACILIGSEDVARRAVMRPTGLRRKTRLVELLRGRPDEAAPAPATESAPVPAGVSESDRTVDCDWFDSNLAELPLNPDGRVIRGADGRRIWVHPDERI